MDYKELAFDYNGLIVNILAKFRTSYSRVKVRVYFKEN